MGVEVHRLEGDIAKVVMNWPERKNSLGPSDAKEVGTAISEAGSDSVSGVVLTGNGAFCAGGDLVQFTELSESSTRDEIRDRVYGNVQSVIRGIRNCPVPVAAAVDGPAIGLGFDYAVACDMCFVGSEGWLQQGWATAGLVHGAGGSSFVQGAGGQAFWKLVAEQERIDGGRAEALGIGEAVAGSAVDAAAERLRRLGRIRREVLIAYTELFRDQRWPGQDFFDKCADFQSKFIASEEFHDRAHAILVRQQSAQGQ